MRSTRETFHKLSDDDKCDILIILGRLPCAGAGVLLEGSSDSTSRTGPFHCHACNPDHAGEDLVLPWHSSAFEELRKTLVDILPKLTRASAPRIASMVALRSILVHEPDCSQLRLTSSVFGELCLHSLRSSVRELRTAAGYYEFAYISRFYEANESPDILLRPSCVKAWILKSVGATSSSS